MADPMELMLSDLQEKYAEQPASPSYTRLYSEDDQFRPIFASLHERLNGHFESINDRALSTNHYWAESSRDMIALISEVSETLGTLRRVGFEVSMRDDYEAAVKQCQPWLSSSGGSAIPDDFESINIIRWEPVFARADAVVKLQKPNAPVSLKLIGEGSYAKVFSYLDPDYGVAFAVKRANKDLSDRDLQRFRNEFDILKRLSFPYIVEVYRYDEVRNEYTMEFCSETLRKYIARRNNKMGLGTRKRIALQFLYGIGYLHRKGHLHRDLSLQNVLVKVFDDDAVLVKLSDFGLVKERDSQFTKTKTEIRGTILDPQLTSFRDYGIPSEVYAIGWVLSYIFTGRESLAHRNDAVSRIVQKCTNHDPTARYLDVRSIIADVEQLEVTPTSSGA